MIAMPSVKLFMYISALLLLSNSSVAQIYKWVDENGNVHFGDKPQAEEHANDVEAVELEESYKPVPLTAEQQETIRREREQRRQIAREIEAEKAQEKAAAKEAKRKQVAERCAELKRDIQMLGDISLEGGQRVFYYLEDEDGKPLSVAEQEKRVEQMRAESKKLGC
jgi:isoleucyl-tRNA synthetase